MSQARIFPLTAPVTIFFFFAAALAVMVSLVLNTVAAHSYYLENPVLAQHGETGLQISSFTINHGTPVTDLHEVALQLEVESEGKDDYLEMRFSGAGGRWTEWERYRPEREWFLEAGPGLRQVVVQVRCANGLKKAEETASIMVHIPSKKEKAASPGLLDGKSPPVYGDLSGSGTVDIADVIILLRHLVGLLYLDENLKEAADVNLDGKVDINDGVIIMRYIIGLLDSLPLDEAPEGPGFWSELLGEAPAYAAPTQRLRNALYRVQVVATVEASRLNVRSGPGRSYPVLGELYKGQRFTVQEEVESEDPDYPSWYRLRYYGKDGYVAVEFTSVENILYGLDFQERTCRLAPAPAGLFPGDYRIDNSYGFQRIEGSELIPTGIEFYFIEHNPYAVLYLERPAASKVTAEFIQQRIESIRPNSPLVQWSDYFIQGQDKWGVNALYLLAHAALESAWGTSAIATDKNNIFGYMAYDSDPYGNAANFRSMGDCILQVSGFIRRSYLSPGGAWFNGPHLVGMNERYATDPMWAFKIAHTMESLLPYDEYEPAEKQLNWGEVAISDMELFTGPGPTNEQVAIMPRGERVYVAGLDSPVLKDGLFWVKILIAGGSGWSSGVNLDFATKPRGAVYFNSWYQEGKEDMKLNVRAGPGTGYPVACQLSFGDSFYIEEMQPVYDETDSKWYLWYCIMHDIDGSELWVRGDYVIVEW